MTQPTEALVGDEPTILQAVWRYRWLVAGIVVLFTGAGVAYSQLQDQSYVATSLLVLEEPSGSALDGEPARAPSAAYMAEQAEIIGSVDVAERATEILAAGSGQATVAELLDGLDVSWNANNGFMTVSMTSGDSATARNGADALAIAYESESLARVVAAIDEQLEDIDTVLAIVGEDLSAVEDEISSMRPAEFEVLDAQSQIALDEFLDLIRRRPDATEEELAVIREDMSDLTRELQTAGLFRELQATQPQMAALLQEQAGLTALRRDVEARRRGLEIDAALATSGVKLFTRAGPAAVLGRSTRVTVGVLAVLGLLLGAFLAASLAYRRRSVLQSHEPESFLHAPLLAEIPDFSDDSIKSDLPIDTDPNSNVAEAFRFLASALVSRRTTAGAASGSDGTLRPVGSQIVVVTSPSRGDGKTVVTANTAMAAALAGSRVLVIDADFSSMTLTRLLTAARGVSSSGITDFVLAETRLEPSTVALEIPGSGELRVMPRGQMPVPAAAFFQSAELPRLLDGLRPRFDLVLIDAPPLLQVAYAMPVARLGDAAVVVVRHKADIVDLEDVEDRLSFVETRTLGYVYNRAPLRRELAGTEGSVGSDSRTAAGSWSRGSVDAPPPR